MSAICPSSIHDHPVEATVAGQFIAWQNPANSGPVVYCTSCARSIESIGYFKPNEQQ
jgi:hypothetical protein